MVDFQIEKKLLNLGYKTIAGVDEAGRGALFGPVMASAVVISNSFIQRDLSGEMEEIDDSKVLAPKKRERLARFILNKAQFVGIGLATSEEIDRDNVHQASLMAMKRAVKNLSIIPDILLIDGFRLKDFDCPQVSLPRGDSQSISIAAASIIA